MPKTTRTVKKKHDADTTLQRKYLLWSILLPLLALFLICIIYYWTPLRYNLNKLFKPQIAADRYSQSEHDARNIALMDSHQQQIFGIDISQYQNKIKWAEVNTINDKYPVDFIFMRATMGASAKDKKFKDYWKASAGRSKIRGAYHYFRPNENSVKQAQNFINTVKLRPGDLPPVLDIEERPKTQSMDSLQVGLKRWLDVVEKHYKVKPIIYSGDSYFNDFLEQEFQGYILWIANYNFWVDSPKDHWDFWQFSEKGTVQGIQGKVDLNMFNGDIEDLEKLAIPF